MNQFRTIVSLPASDNKITYNSGLFFLGSCFTNNIGQKLLDIKFQAIVNPFGVVYNPISVLHSLNLIHENRIFTEDDLRQNNDIWYSFYHHSTFSGIDKKQTLLNINESLSLASKYFKKANFLFITFGTAWIYTLKETGQVVSNCHKLPAKLFTRRRLDIDEIVKQYNVLIEKLHRSNPELQIIFTVSPIRHLKDGVVENQLSKSTLLLACHEIVKDNKRAAYFPAYEILMDDLRDYRFYADDMIHPGSTAINYIWDKFSKVYFEPETSKIIEEIEKILKAKNHRPFNKNTSEYKKFIQANLKKIQLLLTKNPELKLDAELDYFQKEGDLLNF